MRQRAGAIQSADRELPRRHRVESLRDGRLHHQLRQQEEVGRTAAGKGRDDVEVGFTADPHRRPAARRVCSASARCCAVTVAAANIPVTPAPIRAGRFGIVRMTGTCAPTQALSDAIGIPAAMDSSTAPASRNAAASGLSTAPVS